MPKRSTIKAIGMTFITFFLACAIVCIVLAGIDYRYANPDWKNVPWSPLSPLQLASILYAILIAFVGYYVFAYPKQAWIKCYEIFLTLSILFTLAIGIFAIIAGSTGFLDVRLGCNAKIDGILDIWRGMDTYLQVVDQSLCSTDCPCNIKNTVAFTSNSTALPFFNTWNLTNLSYGATAFQNCSGSVRLNAYNQANINNPNFDPKREFNDLKFFNYMSRIEEEFQCTGWCDTTYRNTNLNSDTTMFKYLFSGVNRGPPRHIGCLNQLLQWLPSFLLAFGAVSLVLAGCQIVVLALTRMLASSKKHDDLPQEELHGVPHDRDIQVDRA